MIKTYDSKQPGTIKVFLRISNEEVVSVIIGNQAVSNERGIQFFLDDYVAEQLDKFNISINGVEPVFVLKDGEKLVIPDDVDRKQKEIEELERRLKELKGDDDGAR